MSDICQSNVIGYKFWTVNFKRHHGAHPVTNFNVRCSNLLTYLLTERLTFLLA